MIRRRSARQALVAVALGGVISAGAGAQTLNLGGDAEEPDLAERSRFVRLVQELDHEIQRRLEGVNEEDLDEATRAAIGVRRLAVQLLAEGDTRRAEGELHSLRALQLIDAIPSIDALLGATSPRSGRLDQRAQRRVRAALRRLQRALERFRESPPTTSFQLDRALRDTFSEFGELSELSTGRSLQSGWAPRRPIPENPIAALERAANQLPNAAGARVPMLKLKSALEPALSHPEYAEQAVYLIVRLTEAYDAAHALTTVQWRPTSRVDRVYEWLESATEKLVTLSTRAGGLQMITDLELARELLSAVDGVPSEAKSSRQLREAAMQIESRLFQDPDDPTLARDRRLATRLAGAALRITNEIRETQGFETRSEIPPIARRGRAQLLKRTTETQERAVERLRALIDGESSPEDPSNTSLLLNLRAATTSLTSYVRAVEIAGALGDADTPGAPQSSKRLWDLLDQAPEEGVHAEALREIEAFVPIHDGVYARLASSAHALEEEMNRPDHSSDNLKLVSASIRARSEWLSAWGRGRDSTIERERMERVDALSRLALSRSALRRLQGREASLSRWPAWRIPPGAIDALVAELDLQIVRVIDAIESSPDRIAEAALEGAMRATADARLVARIARELEIRGFEFQFEDPDITSRIGALAIPPTELSWLHEHRAEFARFSRWITEVTAARNAGLRRTARDAAEETDQTALDLLRTLDRAASASSP